MGVVYCLTSPSGKKYIGQTFRNPTKRFVEHVSRADCIIIHNAIKKYGVENFEKDILFTSDDPDILNIMEKKFILDMNTLYPNIRTGGSKGSKHCQESREKMRISKLGDKNHNYGKPRTPEAKKNISLSKKGEKHHFYGKQLSMEHKLNLSKSQKKDNDLPMYLVKIKARPEHYCSSGYAIANHPT